jgi:small subunit ribosomal protein S1
MDQIKEKAKPEESFQELLDEYDYQLPKRGQLLKGEVKTINDEIIILDIGTKRAAIVPSREVKNLDEKLVEKISVGDMVPVHVTRTPIGDENLLVSIDDAKEYENWEHLNKLLDEGESLELEVIAYNKGGLLVQFEQIEGFVPNSLIPALKHVYDRKILHQHKKDMVGSRLRVKPIEVDREKRKLVLSVSAAQKDERQERLNELQVGDVIFGIVTNVVDYGAFIDLSGIAGLLHISEMGWETVKHPSEIVNVGDRVEVQVNNIDTERERVSLTRKPLLPSPWDDVANNYQPGDLVEVKIVNLVDFGAFAELPEGVQGLIHVSELGYYGEDIDALNIGKTVLVKILKVDVDHKRASLSMKQVPLEKQQKWSSSDIMIKIRSEGNLV